MSDVPSSAGNGNPSAGRELILSEEQLAVSTVRRPARRVRLEKFVVTETRTVTVEVSHEQVRLVDLDLDESVDLAQASAEADVDRWLTLSEERVVVTTEVVPVERVRLAVTTVVEQRDVTDDIRRERIQFDHEPHVPFNGNTHPKEDPA